MMSSANSTESSPGRADAGMQPWHFFLLLAMVGATAAVIRARDTQPAALVLLSAAVIAAGLVAIASHSAVSGFFGVKGRRAMPVSTGTRRAIEEEKALVLRAIKELEFDRAMNKVSDADVAEIGGRLRVRAMDLIEQLDRAAAAAEVHAAPSARVSQARACAACTVENDPDARYCKNCGAKLI